MTDSTARWFFRHLLLTGPYIATVLPIWAALLLAAFAVADVAGVAPWVIVFYAGVIGGKIAVSLTDVFFDD